MPSQTHVRIKCSKCGKTVKVPKTSIGKTGKCPGCKSEIKVEAPQSPKQQETEIRIHDSDLVDSKPEKNHEPIQPQDSEKASEVLGNQYSDGEAIVSIPKIKTDVEISQNEESHESNTQPAINVPDVDPDKLPRKMPRNLDGVQEIDVALSQDDICNCSEKFVIKMLLEGKISRFHFARLVKPKPKPDPDESEETQKWRLETWFSDVKWKPIGEGLMKKKRRIRKLYDYEASWMMYIAMPLILLFLIVSSVAAYQLIGWNDIDEYIKKKDLSSSEGNGGFFAMLIMMMIIPVMANWFLFLVLFICFVLSVIAALFSGEYLAERTQQYAGKFHKLISNKKIPPPDGYQTKPSAKS